MHQIVGFVFEQFVASVALEQICPIVHGLMFVVVVLQFEAQIALDALVHAWFSWDFVRFRFPNRGAIVMAADVQPKGRFEVEHLGADDTLQIWRGVGLVPTHFGNYERTAGGIQQGATRWGVIGVFRPTRWLLAPGNHQGYDAQGLVALSAGFAVHFAEHFVVGILIKVVAQFGTTATAEGSNFAIGGGYLSGEKENIF